MTAVNFDLKKNKIPAEGFVPACKRLFPSINKTLLQIFLDFHGIVATIVHRFAARQLLWVLK